MGKNGGRRAGAGRKPGPNGTKVKKGISLTPEVWTFLSRETTAGNAIENTTRDSSSFIEWKVSNEAN